VQLKVADNAKHSSIVALRVHAGSKTTTVALALVARSLFAGNHNRLTSQAKALLGRLRQIIRRAAHVSIDGLCDTTGSRLARDDVQTIARFLFAGHVPHGTRLTLKNAGRTARTFTITT
jgi:hypothetical protein